MTQDLQVTKPPLRNVKTHAPRRGVFVMSTTCRTDAIEGEIRLDSTTLAAVTQRLHYLLTLSARPQYLTAYLAFTHAAMKGRGIKVSQPQKFAGIFGVES
jgi:hypothetical protein